jgi:hypothetical protein
MAKEKEFPATCTGCDKCIALGEGDFLCDELQQICISGYESCEWPISCPYFKKKGGK